MRHTHTGSCKAECICLHRSIIFHNILFPNCALLLHDISSADEDESLPNTLIKFSTNSVSIQTEWWITYGVGCVVFLVDTF